MFAQAALCALRGGHRWTAATDEAGSVVWCSRCGRRRHPRPVAADIHHRSHVNLAYEVALPESADPDVSTLVSGVHRPQPTEDERRADLLQDDDGSGVVDDA